MRRFRELQETVANAKAGATILLKDGKYGLITFVKDQEPEEWTWQNNVYQGVLGISPREGLQASTAFLMTGGGKLLLPTAQTPTAGRGGIDGTRWPSIWPAQPVPKRERLAHCSLPKTRKEAWFSKQRMSAPLPEWKNRCQEGKAQEWRS